MGVAVHEGNTERACWLLAADFLAIIFTDHTEQCSVAAPLIVFPPTTRFCFNGMDVASHGVPHKEPTPLTKEDAFMAAIHECPFFVIGPPEVEASSVDSIHKWAREGVRVVEEANGERCAMSNVSPGEETGIIHNATPCPTNGGDTGKCLRMLREVLQDPMI
jgi:hypothetical protein